MLAALIHLFKKPAGEVVFVPAGLDENDRAAGFETRVEIVPIPIPDAVAKRFALGLGPVFHGIVDHDQIRPKTGHTAANTHRSQPAADGRSPLCSSIDGPLRGEWEHPQPIGIT